MAHRTLGCLEENVGHSRALAAGQPGCDKRIGGVDLRIHPERPAGQEHGHHRHSTRAQTAKQLEVRFVSGTVFDGADVALELRVRILAEDDDRHVRLVFELARRTELGRPAAGAHGLLHSRKNRLAVRKLLIGESRALPRDRPTAALLGNVVCAVSGDQHM